MFGDRQGRPDKLLQCDRIQPDEMADYKSSVLADTHSGVYLRECEADHRYPQRPGRVFAMTMI
jgi:hypothetical protein